MCVEAWGHGDDGGKGGVKLKGKTNEREWVPAKLDGI